MTDKLLLLMGNTFQLSGMLVYDFTQGYQVIEKLRTTFEGFLLCSCFEKKKSTCIAFLLSIFLVYIANVTNTSSRMFLFQHLTIKFTRKMLNAFSSVQMSDFSGNFRHQQCQKHTYSS